MSDIVISVEHIWKKYRLGTIGHRRITKDLQSWWARIRGQDDPNAPIDTSSHVTPYSNPGGDSFWALQDISFQAREGEVIGIIGRNGAGKSTLLKTLSRVTAPSRGQITVTGRIASLLEVGTGFHPDLTGRENVFLNGAILGMSKNEILRKFDEIVAFAEVERFIDTPVKRYSSGMYVRLAFGVAAHLEPEILIVDEVLAVGDAQFQKKCLGKMEDVGREGRTVLFVSHNMPAIQKMCSRALLLDGGQLSLQGDVPTVVNKYLASNTGDTLFWERNYPPGSEAYLEQVFVAKADGSPNHVVETGGNLNLSVFFSVKTQTSNLQINVELLDETGNKIFCSAPQDAGLDVPQSSGRYQAYIVLPSDLLMPITYCIRVVIWKRFVGVLDKTEAIRFLPHETESLVNVTPGGRTGLIALRCDWKIESRP